MRENFEKSLTELLKHEGGFVNHPSDPGGATNLGVTQAVWEDWIDRAVSEENMKALTPAKVAPLYREMYWDRIKGDKLPSGVDYCVFDAAVNSGVSRAAKWLQTTVGAVADGAIGEQTLRQVLLTNPLMIIDKYSANRLAFLQRLATWPTFGKGWERRVKEVEATATGLVDPASQLR
jgi:lysozyme family protein